MNDIVYVTFTPRTQIKMTDNKAIGKEQDASQKAQTMLKEDNVSRIVFDNSKKRTLIFSKDMLANQMRRDTLKIQDSFDAHWDSELTKIDEEYSKACSLIYAALTTDYYKGDSRFLRSAELLSNAANTFIAAIHLLRSGFVLQPGILLRTIVESVATAVHLCTDEKALEKYETGKLDSGYAVKSARTVFPLIAKLYGYYSNNFAHIGELHKTFTGLTPYTEGDVRVNANISMLKYCVLVLYMTSELLFPQFVVAHRYWKPLNPEGFHYAPDEDELKWLATFIGDDDESEMAQSLQRGGEPT